MNRPGIVRYLISKGADVNKVSRIYTFRAMGFQLTDFDIVATDHEYIGGRVISPLMLAKEKGREEIIKILKDAGAK